MPSYSLPLIEGFLLSIGLIVGVGPQNTLVLRQGVRRQHLLLVVLLCIFLDSLLIALGTLGVGAVQSESFTKLITFAGTAALLFFGGCSFKAAFLGGGSNSLITCMPSRRQVVMALLAVSLLNPSVYIDNLLLIGGSAARYQDELRLWFAAGASLASLVWFVGLGFGSAMMGSWLAQPKVLRGLDALSGAILWWMALRLWMHMG